MCYELCKNRGNSYFSGTTGKGQRFKQKPSLRRNTSYYGDRTTKKRLHLKELAANFKIIKNIP